MNVKSRKLLKFHLKPRCCFQLRYQKCLDAHPGRATAGAGAQGKGLGATIKSLVSGLTGRRSRTSES